MFRQLKMTKCLLLTQKISPTGGNPESSCDYVCCKSGKKEQINRLKKINYRYKNYTLPPTHAKKQTQKTGNMKGTHTKQTLEDSSAERCFLYKAGLNETDIPIDTVHKALVYLLGFFEIAFFYLNSCFCFLPILFHLSI